MKKSTKEFLWLMIAIVLMSWTLFLVLEPIKSWLLRFIIVLICYGVLCVLWNTYLWFKTYSNYKDIYYLMREANKKYQIASLEGKSDEAQKYSDWINEIRNDMVEAEDFLLESSPWLPKNKLKKIKEEVEQYYE